MLKMEYIPWRKFLGIKVFINNITVVKKLGRALS